MDKLQEIISRLKGWLFESKNYEPIETLDNYLDIEDVDILVATIEQQQKEIERYREAIDRIMECVNEHLSDGTEINPYKIEDIVDVLEESK